MGDVQVELICKGCKSKRWDEAFPINKRAYKIIICDGCNTMYLRVHRPYKGDTLYKIPKLVRRIFINGQ